LNEGGLPPAMHAPIRNSLLVDHEATRTDTRAQCHRFVTADNRRGFYSGVSSHIPRPKRPGLRERHFPFAHPERRSFAHPNSDCPALVSRSGFAQGFADASGEGRRAGSALVEFCGMPALGRSDRFKNCSMSRVASRQPWNSVRGCNLPKHLPWSRRG
jgi:hypothetical protein